MLEDVGSDLGTPLKLVTVKSLKIYNCSVMSTITTKI